MRPGGRRGEGDRRGPGRDDRFVPVEEQFDEFDPGPVIGGGPADVEGTRHGAAARGRTHRHLWRRHIDRDLRHLRPTFPARSNARTTTEWAPCGIPGKAYPNAPATSTGGAPSRESS